MASIQTSMDMIHKISGSLQNITKDLSMTMAKFEEGQKTVMAFSCSLKSSQMVAEFNKINNAVEEQTNHFKNLLNMAGKISNSGSKMFSSLKNSVPVRGVADLVKGQMGPAMQSMDNVERFERSMTAITGNSSVAKAALEELKSVTKGTSYGLDTAAASVQNFTTRGMNIKDATAEVKNWADAVAFYGNGTNEELSAVTNTLAAMMSRGFVDMDQLSRLTEMGIPVLDMYAQATGQTVAAVQDDLNRGRISAQNFITTVSSAFTTGTNGVANISGAAGKAGNTWSGAISNMRGSVIQGISSMIENINDASGEAGFGTAQEGLKGFGEIIGSILPTIGSIIGSGITFFAEHGDQILGIIQVLFSLAAAYMIVAGAIGIVTTVITICQTVMTLFGTIAGLIFGVISIVAIAGVAFAIFSLIDWIKDLNGKTGDIGETMELVFKKIQITIMQLGVKWSCITGGIKISWNLLCQAIETAWRTIYMAVLQGVYGIGNTIRSMVNGAIDLINGLIGALNKIPGVSINTIEHVQWSGIDEIGRMAQEQRDKIDQLWKDTDKKNMEIADEITDKEAAADQAQREYDALYKEYTTNNDDNKGKGPLEENPFGSISATITNIGDDTKKTAANTADLSDQLSVTTEQLKYLKDYATAKAVNRYTSSTIKVAMNNHNNISSNMDLDGITNHLKTQLEEKLSSTAEGVYA